MNAVDFLKAKEDMCSTYESCWKCPLGKIHNNRNTTCEALLSVYPDEAVRIVETWAESHPDVVSIHYLTKDNLPYSYTTLITEAKNFEQRDYGEFWEVKK